MITVIDSYDDTIGKRCVVDEEEMIYAFDELADWLGVDMVQPKIIDGEAFGKEGVNDAIDNWLKEQQPTRNDIVVFYYSGHGFRFPNDASEYPRMWLKTSTDRNPETANLRMEEDIYDRIVTMGAGVNIVLSDCCNTLVAGENAQVDQANVAVRKRVSHKREKPKEEEQPDDVDNAEKLFMPAQPLSILATASGPGEFAAGKTESGGFFTNYLLKALDDCIYEEKLSPSWRTIFQYVDKNAGYWAKSAACPQARHNEKGRCIQTLKYKLVNGD